MIMVSGQVNTPVPATPAVPQRLHQAATQFEAMLLKDLLRPLSATKETADDGMEQGDGPLQDFALDAVANSMARSGVLGFARQIEQALTSARSGKTSPNGSSHDTPGRYIP